MSGKNGHAHAACCLREIVIQRRELGAMAHGQLKIGRVVERQSLSPRQRKGICPGAAIGLRIGRDRKRREQIQSAFKIGSIYSPSSLRCKQDIGHLKSPEGLLSKDFDRRIDSLARPFVDPEYWRTVFQTFRIADLATRPGLWSLDFFVNERPMGTYRFWLGDPTTVARLKNQSTSKASEDASWLSERIIVTRKGEWLAYANSCQKQDGRIPDIFLARGSDGHWYYSTYHFCVGMVVLRMVS